MRLGYIQDRAYPEGKEDEFGVKHMSVRFWLRLDHDLTTDSVDKAAHRHHPREHAEKNTAIIGDCDFGQVCHDGGSQATTSHSGKQLGDQVDSPIFGDNADHDGLPRSV